MAKQKGISLNPKDKIKGSNLIDDFDGTITDAGFELWTYPNTSIEVVAMFLEIQADSVDGNPTTREHYAAGNPKLVQASEDGCCLEPAGDKEYDGLNDQSVAIFALTHAVNAGYPTPDKLNDGNASVLKGERFHFKRVDRKDAGGQARQSLVPTRYLGTATGAAKGNGKAVVGGGDLEEKVQSAVMEVLAENPEGLTTSVLAQKVNKQLAGDPDRMAGLKLVMTEKFLKGGPFTYDGKRVTL